MTTSTPQRLTAILSSTWRNARNLRWRPDC
jgi:hypothetical protein